MSRLRVSSIRLASVCVLALWASTCLADGGKIDNKITGVYSNVVGSVIRVDMATPIINSGSWTCTVPSGKTFNGSYAIVLPDYSSTQKTEGVKQVFSLLHAALLAARPIQIYSFGCAADPWNSDFVVATIYDVVVR